LGRYGYKRCALWPERNLLLSLEPVPLIGKTLFPINDWYDYPIDQVQVFAKAHGYDRLDIEDIHNRVLGPVVESRDILSENFLLGWIFKIVSGNIVSIYLPPPDGIVYDLGGGTFLK